MRPNERRQTFNKPSTFSPTQRAEAEHKATRTMINTRLMGQGLGGRTPQKSYICPARAYAFHPDKDLRKLADAQAHEFHRLNDYIEHGEIHAGPCKGKRCKAQRTGVSVQYSGKVAIKWRQQVGRNVLGGGAFR